MGARKDEVLESNSKFFQTALVSSIQWHSRSFIYEIMCVLPWNQEKKNSHHSLKTWSLSPRSSYFSSEQMKSDKWNCFSFQNLNKWNWTNEICLIVFNRWFPNVLYGLMPIHDTFLTRSSAKWKKQKWEKVVHIAKSM